MIIFLKMIHSYVNKDRFRGTELPLPLGYNFSFPSNLRGLGISGAFLNLNLESSITNLVADPLPLLELVLLGEIV
jgi:hypothetical protein